MTSAFPELAAVDLAPLFDRAAGDTSAIDRATVAAMQGSNGFVATGFPGADRLERRIGDLLAFFRLPEAVRMATATRRNRPDSAHVYRGYFPAPEDKGWAHNEIFDYGPPVPSRVPPGHRIAPVLEETNQWPAPAPHDRWRDDAETLLADLRAVSIAVMAALVRGLALDEAAFMQAFDGSNGTLRILHYPPAPEGFVASGRDPLPARVDASGRRIVTVRHTDACVLSLLWQDAVGGLQYEAPDGAWQEVPARPGCLSIHCGRAAELMTGGRLKGTPHRVIGLGRDRYSMGMFLEPEFSAVIAIGDDGTAETYADHMLEDLAGIDIYAEVMGDILAA